MKDDFCSAWRLRIILLKAKEQPNHLTVSNVWADVFRVQEDLPIIFGKLALAQELVNEVEADIFNIENIDHDVYLEYLPAIRKAVAYPNFAASWGSVKELLSEAALSSLQYCSQIIKRNAGEKVVPEDELMAILSGVNELFSEIQGGSLNKKLRTVLLDMLESMRRAIDEYRIRGAKGLRKELFNIFEQLQRNAEIIKEHKSEPAVSAVWELLTKYDTLTSIYVNTSQMIGNLQRLLL